MKKTSFVWSIMLVCAILLTSCTSNTAETVSSQEEQEQAVAVIVALTQTAIAMEKDAQEALVEATPEPKISEEGLTPLADDCAGLQAMMEPELQLMVASQVVPVERSWSGETGSACQLTALANGNNFGSIYEPEQAMLTLMAVGDWMRVEYPLCLGYSGFGPAATAACFVKDQATCDLAVTVAPVDQSLCPEDMPIGGCLDVLEPEQRIFTITLTCAQGTSVVVAEDIEPFDLGFMESVALTGVPYMFPASFPTGDGAMEIYPNFNFRDAEIYEITLDYTPDCFGASACHYGVIMGKQSDGVLPTGTVNYPYMPDQGQMVSLAQGIQGYFMEANCGASCGDAVVYWLYGGYEFMVGLKAGSMEDVVALANATILNSIQ